MNNDTVMNKSFQIQGHTILIIEDNPNNLGVIVDYLEEMGLKIVVARNGEMGLKRAQFAQPDLILLDVMMLGIDGFETCRRLKDDVKTKDIPVIFMTALDDPEDKLKGFGVGGVDYITKPIQHEEVFARVTTHLRIRNLTLNLNTKVEELTKTRQELIQSDKMASLGRLVAGFAHELNTPLGVAIGSASSLQVEVKKIDTLMKQEEIDVDELLSGLDNINKGFDLTLSNLDRAANLVTSFKRTAVDQTSDEIRKFNVNEVINDTINTLHSHFKKIDVNIQVNCPNTFDVNSLPGALEQILTNLLMNSLVHGFNEGQNTGLIYINVQLDAERLHLKYSDNGKGIEQKNMGKIFEPFFTTHRAHGGSGLGMYICYNIITTQLHGTINCESEPGKGVVFEIDYPI
ncbi:MAG: hybrid sensor histidine kinase/response regulator [Proteobacteria bacterium]|nr:hybrid sensor histidine kinase/response regulator [Pseudomonadota bacterium]